MNIKKYKNIPNGILTLQTIAMPSKINSNGNIFGGWIMSQIDLSGGILAKEISGGKVSTLKIKKLIFYKPINSGDLISCYSQIKKIGNTSITIDIEIWIKKINSDYFGKFYQSTKATLIYVAIDNKGIPRKIFPISII
ncbi:hotdog domain-containing protein [Buchnera aphidicola (Kurisakia onigurumii)]|uniref:hotdog domain-containing protein n=1 Tax=Buchnera aphidicola TaxID=9 RepID=UPI0031B6FAA8